MMVAAEHEDLGLSLSLAPSPAMMLQGVGAISPSSFRLAGIQSLPESSPPPVAAFLRHRSQLYWSDLLARSDVDPRPQLKGIDVNRSADGEREIEDDDAGGTSSPNSTLSCITGKRGEMDPGAAAGGDGGDADRACSRSTGGSDDEDGGEGSRKKLRLSKDQSAILEDSFKEHNTLNPKEKQALARKLSLRPRQVEVWFQNRRARTKLKQTEVDCEHLKRFCESLTEENRRLQKEVAELRALKLSPQFYMHMPPPTTLTMCPSCERVQHGAAAASSPELSTDIRRPAAGAGAAPMTPWAPIPIRPSFLHAAPRS